MLGLPDVAELVDEQILVRGGLRVPERDRPPERIGGEAPQVRQAEEPGRDDEADAVGAHRARVVVEPVEARPRALQRRGHGTFCGVKRLLLALLERARLLRPAFRGYERLQALRGVEAGGVPPARLRVRVAGTADLDWFLDGGRLAAETVREAAARHGRPLEQVQALLDFGCGCGRVLRHWGELPGRVHGSDPDRPAVEWVRRHLPFARVEVNALAPPLQYGESSFDLAYAFSVLTHLPEELQRAWLVELHRVLRPGGLLLLSTHGEHYRERLSEPEREQFDAGGIVVRWEQAAGTNLCAVYHPRASLERLAGGLTLLEHVPEGARGNPHQDLTVLRRD